MRYADGAMNTLYEELRRAARNLLRGERSMLLLQPTVLIHEAYLRLRRRKQGDWTGRTQFVCAAVGEMRRVLIDQVRADQAAKRGGGRAPLMLDTQMLVLDPPSTTFVDLHEALERLASLSPRQARVVELRFFGGLSEEEIAENLQVSRRTVQDDWRGARAWLRRALSNGPTVPGDVPKMASPAIAT